MTQKTHSLKAKDIHRHWHLIDLKGKILGRAASQIALKLQGKHKPYFTPHLDCGDYVVAINAQDIKVTGRKAKQKTYFRHSGYPGGAKHIPFERMMNQDPRQVIKLAVTGMLPKNKLRQPRLKRLKIFADNNHPYKDKIKKK
jgi:large subunit ribosomal protein L13